MNTYTLPKDTHIGYVHLRVRSLKQELKFYKDILGFHEADRDGGTVYLSADEKKPYHVILTESANASPRQPFTTGLFHLAIRVPNRSELAKMFLRLYENKYPFQGFADHGVSEALYMADPEGNGVEIYVDRPRDQWPRKNGKLEMGTDPLDINGLIKELTGGYKWSGLHPQTDIGHIHLQVSNLSGAKNFYQNALGMDIMQDSFPGALFLSAGGYHHHIGVNIWSSSGAAPADKGALGLAAFGLHITGTEHDLVKQLEANNCKISNTDGKIFTEDQDRNRIEFIFS